MNAANAAAAVLATDSARLDHANAPPTGNVAIDTTGPDDDSSSDESDDPDPASGEDADPDEDIASGRWRFLSRYFDRWFQSTQYGDHASSTSVDLRFHSFFVFLPYMSTVSAEANRFLRQLRDATELVGSMLYLDKNTWWYVKKIRKPWFRGFYPSNYDPEEMIPKMTFVLHQRFGPGDEKPTALKRLEYLLIDCAREENEAFSTSKFWRAKRQIQDECDPENRLRGFKLPIAIQLRPEKPKHGELLKKYLQDVVELVVAVQGKSGSSSYAFRLDEINLDVYAEHVSDAHDEFVRLFSLGVPVTLRLRHSHSHISLPFAWSDFGWRANLFPALVDRRGSGPAPIHSVISREIHISPELLSAIAFSTSVRSLEIEPNEENESTEELTNAKWLAYALKINQYLVSLVLHQFQASHQILDVMQSVVEASDPARLLSESQEGDASTDIPQVVKLQADAKIQTLESRKPETFAELNLSSEWELPVVRSSASEVEFVLPGHAIGSTKPSSVASVKTDQEQMSLGAPRSLKSLALNEAYFDPGTVPRFLRLFGQSLEELRWTDGVGGCLDQDLGEALAACPGLVRLYLQGSSLQSLTSFTRRFEHPSCQLQTLSLIHTSIPMAAMVEFFALLGDETTRIAQTLRNFSYYCPGHSLDHHAAEAALTMLSTNRVLQSITLGIASRIYDDYEDRFQDERDTQIKVERLPLASKVAMCSVVRHYNQHQTRPSVAKLDGTCLSLVFQYFAAFRYRCVRVIQSQ